MCVHDAAGLDFLKRSVRTNGSWPIDTNLATWVTTLGVNALAAGGPLPLDKPQRDAACAWLLDLQNTDGGIPTFCRGWGALLFDRSSPDLTAHALRAWLAWRGNLSDTLERRLEGAVPRAIRYLRNTQRSDGAWAPLWFGNQHAPDDINLTYGTSRVLSALAELQEEQAADTEQAAESWLIETQGADGGWGGVAASPPSIEETSLAVSALATRLRRPCLAHSAECRRSVERGVDWLIRATKEGCFVEPSPIGFYFAKLWYFERLYPVIFAVEALTRALAASRAGSVTHFHAE